VFKWSNSCRIRLINLTEDFELMSSKSASGILCTALTLAALSLQGCGSSDSSHPEGHIDKVKVTFLGEAG
jgi:hypothetical protein